MASQNHQDLFFIKITKLLGINSHYSENNSLPEVVIPNFVITQLSEFLEQTDSISRCSAHMLQDTVVQNTAIRNKEYISLKDIFHSLLTTANAFTQVQRKQALENVLTLFQEVRASLVLSEMYDLASLMSLVIESIQLACRSELIQEQNLLIVQALDTINEIINEINFVCDNEQSRSSTLETIDMSYENLQLNMSYFAAKEISLND